MVHYKSKRIHMPFYPYARCNFSCTRTIVLLPQRHLYLWLFNASTNKRIRCICHVFSQWLISWRLAQPWIAKEPCFLSKELSGGNIDRVLSGTEESGNAANRTVDQKLQPWSTPRVQVNKLSPRQNGWHLLTIFSNVLCWVKRFFNLVRIS